MNEIVLYGAGTTGRVIVRDLKNKGQACVLVDSDKSKWGLIMEGVEVISPHVAKILYEDSVWVASVIRPERKEVMTILEKMGVRTEPVWGYLPKHRAKTPLTAIQTIEELLGDQESVKILFDQRRFRADPGTFRQEPASNIDEIYWPDFIKHRDDEHYVDCGAWEGDTVTEFIKRWNNYKYISAFEPDKENFVNLKRNHSGPKFYAEHAAVSDFEGQMVFTATGDMSAHLGGTGEKVSVVKLDTYFPTCEPVPTYIKMDIEGSELEALWGARRIIKEHSPVLAVCAYHEASHLWEIPLLIHALQPEYKLFFRRYAECAFEIVWYAVPPERIQ